MKKVYVISSVIGVCLLAGGTWFVLSTRDRAHTESPVVETPSQSVDTSTKGKETDKNTETTKNPSPDDSAFNKVMDSARTAFRNKDYSLALKSYTEALSYKKTDTVYAGMYTVYAVQGEWSKALESLNKAIALQPLLSDYWKWKIGVMNEHQNASFAELTTVYTESLKRVKSDVRINMMTYFAGVAESRGEKAEAVRLWQAAIQELPSNTAIYQAEIKRIESAN